MSDCTELTCPHHGPANREALRDGPKRRPDNGDYPGCGAPVRKWCSAECDYIDPMNYR